MNAKIAAGARIVLRDLGHALDEHVGCPPDEEETCLDALRHHLRLRQRSSQCTGIAAVWCPVHGRCSSPSREEGRLCEDESCPLHGPASSHADEEVLQ